MVNGLSWYIGVAGPVVGQSPIWRCNLQLLRLGILRYFIGVFDVVIISLSRLSSVNGFALLLLEHE